MKYPIRINRYLALENISSRREADELIRLEKVWINGRLAKLGDQVSEKDKVEIKNDSAKKLVYYAFNKPLGIITHSPQRNEKSIADVVKISEEVFPLGRLDKDSHGLIILSNDGRITGKLLSPEKNHEKEYIVAVNRPITESFIRKMSGGVKLDDGVRTKEAKAQKINDFLFSIILTEGKKRQIRRMCAALNFAVRDLKRVRIMNIKLGKLKPGEARKIEGQELENFLVELKIVSCLGSGQSFTN